MNENGCTLENQATLSLIIKTLNFFTKDQMSSLIFQTEKVPLVVKECIQNEMKKSMRKA